VHFAADVLVGVAGDDAGGVAEDFLDDLDVEAGFQHEGGGGVPGGVQFDHR
jgi:hypothetical protein